MTELVGRLGHIKMSLVGLNVAHIWRSEEYMVLKRHEKLRSLSWRCLGLEQMKRESQPTVG